MTGRLPLFVLAATALCACMAPQAAHAGDAAAVRGAAPQDLAQYLADHLECDGKKLPASVVNDDYCDCADGRDEPGTSACSNGKFFCENKGHEPLVLYSSRVNDGICDCCDGTDEYDGRAVCANECGKYAEAKKAQLEADIATYEAGLAAAAGAQDAAKAKEKELLQELAESQEVASKLQTEVDDLEVVKSDAEEKENAVRNEKKKEWEETWAVWDAARAAREEAAQAEAEAAAAAAAAAGGEEIPADDAGDAAPAPGAGDDGGEPEPQYEEYIDPAAQELRDQYDSQKRTLDDATNRVKEIQARLEMDFGPGGEYAMLYGECFTSRILDYDYELCPFSSSKQSGTSIGTWGKWLDGGYKRMEYTGGASCWQGPDRSTIVTLACGSEAKITGVVEPSKCVYAMDFVTPAACSQEHLNAMRLELESLQ